MLVLPDSDCLCASICSLVILSTELLFTTDLLSACHSLSLPLSMLCELANLLWHFVLNVNIEFNGKCYFVLKSSLFYITEQ